MQFKKSQPIIPQNSSKKEKETTVENYIIQQNINLESKGIATRLTSSREARAYPWESQAY